MYQEEEKGHDIFFSDKYQTHSTFKLPENKNNASKCQCKICHSLLLYWFVQLPIKWTARKSMKSWEAGHCQDWNTTCSRENWTRLVPNIGRHRGILDRLWMGLVLKHLTGWSIFKARQTWKHMGYCQPAWFNGGKISFLTQAEVGVGSFWKAVIKENCKMLMSSGTARQKGKGLPSRRVLPLLLLRGKRCIHPLQPVLSAWERHSLLRMWSKTFPQWLFLSLPLVWAVCLLSGYLEQRLRNWGSHAAYSSLVLLSKMDQVMPAIILSCQELNLNSLELTVYSQPCPAASRGQWWIFPCKTQHCAWQDDPRQIIPMMWLFYLYPRWSIVRCLR